MQAMEAGLSEVKNELQSRDDLLRIIEMERLHLHRELLKMGEFQAAHDNRKRYSSHLRGTFPRQDVCVCVHLKASYLNKVYLNYRAVLRISIEKQCRPGV